MHTCCRLVSRVPGPHVRAVHCLQGSCRGHDCWRPLAGTKDQWYTFNDEVVVKTQASSVATANAYILFYVRRNV